ncbi:MAG: DASS family sodium-coupled anion symporter [Parvularculaceae bacterium]
MSADPPKPPDRVAAPPPSAGKASGFISRNIISAPHIRLSGRPALRGFAFFLNEKRWLLIALLAGLVLYMAPTPDGLSREGHIVFAISLVAVILFVSEPIPLPATALMIIVAQRFLLHIDPNEIARSLMNDSVLFILGSLMLAVAIVKQSLDKRIAFLIVRLTGTSTMRICFGLTLFCGVMASVIGEHTVAAMMLPVALSLLVLTGSKPEETRKLAPVLLFSIAFGCAIGGIGTPSGGARNAILIGYLKDFFYDPADPETKKYLVSYLTWMKYCFPVFLVQLPIVVYMLMKIFKPTQKDLGRAVTRLRTQIREQGEMKSKEWAAIALFAITLIGWVTLSEDVGLGIVAISGATLFLVFGLVRWSDINSGVNWGVVLLYAAAISLGGLMQHSGGAAWMATTLIDFLSPFGLARGAPLIFAIIILTTVVTNTMSAGAAVAVLGPIVLKTAVLTGSSPIALGYALAIASSFAFFTAAAHPAFTIIYSSGYVKASDFPKAGWRIAIASIAILMAAATLYWPVLGV